MTPEEIQKSVSAAFDSVNLIEQLEAKETLTDEEQSTITRNKEHLTIMLGYEWFSEALTPEQQEQILNVI